MPRIAREKSESGIYHIILRGTNRQEIFHDDEDSLRFLETLDRYKKKAKFKVHGWCLMGNHVHLLLEEGNEDLSVTMKRIGISFVWFYNWKYRVTGHLFQDRYKSEKVDSDEYLLTVIKYIHQNPVKAGLVRKAAEWKWSSCSGYYNGKSYPPGLLDREFILGLCSEDINTAIDKFRGFNESGSEDKCMDNTVAIRFTDEEARAAIEKVISGLKITGIKSLPKVQRDELLRRIKGVEGVTQRQASRILGISPNLIFKA